MSQISQLFGSDKVLLYNVDPWSRMGFGVANFGDNWGTANQAIWGLADEISRVQLFVMTHIDVWRSDPPSVNTIIRIGKLLNRIQQVLAARQMAENQIRVEEKHASASVKPWNIHPAPYHGSAFMRNHWLSEYNELVMIGLTNIYQYSDNNLAMTITEKFASDIWQYFRQIKIRMGTELLLLPREQVEGDTFLFTEEIILQNYKPSDVIVNMEALDTPGPIETRPTEDDLRPLFRGIPSTDLIADLAQYPVAGNGLGFSGSDIRPGAEAVGTEDGRQIQQAGGTIGQPTI
ncbi:MAG: hypothetical protein AAF961_10790 [Planctomycetota bacterium]